MGETGSIPDCHHNQSGSNDGFAIFICTLVSDLHDRAGDITQSCVVAERDASDLGE
jgi:hypothetical protein